jgi:hypothetical protein
VISIGDMQPRHLRWLAARMRVRARDVRRWFERGIVPRRRVAAVLRCLDGLDDWALSKGLRD